jgi:hypothetical protein
MQSTNKMQNVSLDVKLHFLIVFVLYINKKNKESINMKRNLDLVTPTHWDYISTTFGHLKFASGLSH